MKIFIGTDHAGFELKEDIVSWLKENNYEVEDFGASEYDPTDDYPDFVRPVAEAVSENPENSRGIVLGGSGQGEAILANRFKGVRAGVYYGGSYAGEVSLIKIMREHNDINVLSLGARFMDKNIALEAVSEFLEVPFPGDDRHVRRIAKIDK